MQANQHQDREAYRRATKTQDSREDKTHDDKMRTRIILCSAALLALSSACAQRNRLSSFTYLHHPAGYHWKAERNLANGDIVYYGTDPRTHQTVYVGPDNAYYSFAHPAPIEPSDLHAYWIPHDAS